MDEPQKKCIYKQKRKRWELLPKDKSLFSVPCGFGIPIGNLNSQIFANYFLDDFDKYIINTLGFKYYGRYVDDFYILSKTKEELLELIPKMKEKLSEIGIRLHPKKIYIQHINKGVKFVGAVIKPNRTYISNRTKGNIYQMLNRAAEYIKNNEPTLNDIEYIVNSINSYLGYLKHHKTYKIRKKILTSEQLKPWTKYFYVDKSLLKVCLFKEYSQYNKGISKEDLFNQPWKYRIDIGKLPGLLILN